MFRMGKLGRKIRCEFNNDIQCFLLVDGYKLCLFDETTEEQFCEKHEVQFWFCPLLPESEKAQFLAFLEEEGFSKVKSIRS